MEMRSSRTRMMIFKIKEEGDADCSEQRRNEASPSSFILENHTAAEHKHFHIYTLCTVIMKATTLYTF